MKNEFSDKEILEGLIQCVMEGLVVPCCPFCKRKIGDLTKFLWTGAPGLKKKAKKYLDGLDK